MTRCISLFLVYICIIGPQPIMVVQSSAPLSFMEISSKGGVVPSHESRISASYAQDWWIRDDDSDEDEDDDPPNDWLGWPDPPPSPGCRKTSRIFTFSDPRDFSPGGV